LYFGFDADPAFEFDTEPDPAFHSDDPASKNDADSDPDPPHWVVDFQTFSESKVWSI
jgi:hypothetical protein